LIHGGINLKPADKFNAEILASERPSAGGKDSTIQELQVMPQRQKFSFHHLLAKNCHCG